MNTSTPSAVARTAPAPKALTPTNPQNPEVSRESLGTQTVEGEVAEGVKSTRTWAVGSLGNDRPIVATVETWIAKDLKLMILSKMSDVRFGERTQRISNLSRSEPDPELFRPPADYKVLDEEGEFTIEITEPR